MPSVDRVADHLSFNPNSSRLFSILHILTHPPYTQRIIPNQTIPVVGARLLSIVSRTLHPPSITLQLSLLRARASACLPLGQSLVLHTRLELIREWPLKDSDPDTLRHIFGEISKRSVGNI